MILTTILLGAGLQAATPAGVQDTSRMVSGNWSYDKAESDDRRTLIMDRGGRDTTGGPGEVEGRGGRGGRSRGEGREPGAGGDPAGRGIDGGLGGTPGMGGGGYGGRRGMGGDRRGGPLAGAFAGRRALLGFVFHAPERLELREAGATVELVTDGRDSVTLPTNGHKVEWRGGDSVKVELRARYVSGRLTVERKVSETGTVTETYYRSPDATQLFVLVRYQPFSESQPVLFRRIYDHAAVGG